MTEIEDIEDKEDKEAQQPFKEITISSGNTEAKIAPERGGLVTEFKVDGENIFYLDRKTFDDPVKNVRGGIPVLFPNAGNFEKNNLYQVDPHGFARRMPWKVIEQNQNSVTIQLLSTDETKKVYPHDFEVQLVVSVKEDPEEKTGRLEHKIIIINKEKDPMPSAYGIHPYFEIPQDLKSKVTTNIEGLDPEKIDWPKEYDVQFDNPGITVITVPSTDNYPSREITIKSDPNFKKMYAWSLPDSGFICFEPWVGPDNAMNNPEQCIWTPPRERLILPVSISAKISK